MGTVSGINSYSDSYIEYGKKVLAESAATLEKSGIKVFPQDKDSPEKKTASCVVIKPEDVTPETKPQEKKKGKETKNEASWIREAMPGTNNHMSGFSSVMSDCLTEMGNFIEQKNSVTASETDADTDEASSIIQDMEDHASNIDKLSNASGDEGEGNLLQTFFEKEVPKGFHSDNYAGTKYEKNIKEDSYESNVTIYSDNMYNRGNFSAIFGGTAEFSSTGNTSENIKNFDYNMYTYAKYRAKKLTYGAGAMNTKNDGVRNVNISFGAQHNETGIYAIVQKKLNIIPGQQTRTETDINVGIGQSSGLLDPDVYNKKSNKTGTIDESAKEFIEGREANVFNPEDSGLANNTVVNLIISDTDIRKEYGVKVGHLFKYETKKQNYAFVMPYGQISNTSIDSKEGAELTLGVITGQDTNTANGWNLKTKGIVEAARHVQQGQSPSDYILTNINFKATRKNFSGEVAAGAYRDNDSAYCGYLEAQADYAVSNGVSVGLKANSAHYKFNADSDSRNFYELTAGIKVKLGK